MMLSIACRTNFRLCTKLWHILPWMTMTMTQHKIINIVTMKSLNIIVYSQIGNLTTASGRMWMTRTTTGGRSCGGIPKYDTVRLVTPFRTHTHPVTLTFKHEKIHSQTRSTSSHSHSTHHTHTQKKPSEIFSKTVLRLEFGWKLK